MPLDLKIRQQADSGQPTLIAEPDGKVAQLYKDMARKLAGPVKVANLFLCQNAWRERCTTQGLTPNMAAPTPLHIEDAWFDLVPLALIEFNEHGRVLRANSALSAQLGYAIPPRQHPYGGHPRPYRGFAAGTHP